MTAAQLIKILQKLHPDTIVVMNEEVTMINDRSKYVKGERKSDYLSLEQFPASRAARIKGVPIC